MFMLASAIVSPAAGADSSYVQQLVERAVSDRLHDTRGWRALLHYKPGGWFTQWESQADDTAFFLSPEGKTDPEAELRATLHALAEPVNGSADDHPQCRFPARYHWLKHRLAIDPGRLKPVMCEQLNAWFDTIRPGSLTLVFPAAYINSPSSMFGHTLLRVNPNDYRKDSALVAYALNYAANADATDSALVFSVKGLIGGYPGVFSIVPYYEKIREYRDLENRDVWEYSLDFSQQEIDQLMRHAWEVRHIRFDYYFLTENCSYHMLSLMEVARPQLDLTSDFDIKAIPADTVRAVYDAGLVLATQYRPSSTTVIKHHAAQMTEQANRLAIAITNGELPAVRQTIGHWPARQQAQVLEQAYDYARFLTTSDPTARDPRARLNWQLLAERSRLGLKNIWQPIDEPPIRSEQGHRTSRLAYVAGMLDDDAYIGLRFRPAYHDVLDPPQGYSAGAQINFLDLSVRYDSAAESLRLDKLTFINVLSLTPRDAYFHPVSWGVDFAVQRQPARNGEVNAIQLVANGGYSSRFFPDVTASLLGEVNARAAGRYDKGYTAGAGLKLNLLYQQSGYSWQIGVKAVAFSAGEQNLHQRVDLGLAWHRDVNHSLRLGFSRVRDYDRLRSDIQLAWQLYF